MRALFALALALTVAVVGAADITNPQTNASQLNSGTMPAAQLPAFGSGNVSCASGGGACTIAAGAVTNAMRATLAANTISCNATGGAATPTDCTAATIKSLLAIANTDITGLGTFATQNFATPPAIGATTPSTGAFTTLSTTGDATVGTNTGTRNIFINGAAATQRSIFIRTAGSNRWQMAATSTAEAGSNAGSDFAACAYSDAAAFLDCPLVITRAITGTVAVTRHLASTGTAPAASVCGTGSPSVSGSDTKGVITTATAATACTLTFAAAYATAPVCVATASTSASAVGVTAVSTSAVTFGLSAALTGTIYYVCVQ